MAGIPEKFEARFVNWQLGGHSGVARGVRLFLGSCKHRATFSLQP